MKFRNRIIVGLVVLGILLSGVVYGAVIPGLEKERETRISRQQHPLTHDISEVVKFRHPYMGNASNLSNLFLALPLNQLERSMQLYPDTLTAEFHYTAKTQDVDPHLLKQSLIYNATAAFALIGNLDTLRFDFSGEVFSVQRSDVEAWYAAPSDALIEPEVWEQQVQIKLADAEYVEECAKAIIK